MDNERKISGYSGKYPDKYAVNTPADREKSR